MPEALALSSVKVMSSIGLCRLQLAMLTYRPHMSVSVMSGFHRGDLCESLADLEHG